MVVWIEIALVSSGAGDDMVTTCVVVWIEIQFLFDFLQVIPRHHLRGGVD